MLANPDIGVTQIAHRLGVSPATLYRYIPAARTANISGGLGRPRLPQKPDAAQAGSGGVVERPQWVDCGPSRFARPVMPLA
jgi:transposase-like protein